MAQPISADLCVIQSATSLTGLLVHNGERFVQVAVLTLLNRKATREEVVHYLSAFFAGASKMSILNQIYLQLPADQGLPQITNLRKALRRHGRLSHPIYGKIYRLFGLKEFGDSTRMRMVRIERQLALAQIGIQGWGADMEFEYEEDQLNPEIVFALSPNEKIVFEDLEIAFKKARIENAPLN